METAAQREATWNETVHSFDSQVLAQRKKRQNNDIIRNEINVRNGTIFSVFLVTLQFNGLLVLQIHATSSALKTGFSGSVRPIGRDEKQKSLIINSFMISTQAEPEETPKNVGSRMERTGKKKQVGGETKFIIWPGGGASTLFINGSIKRESPALHDSD